MLLALDVVICFDFIGLRIKHCLGSVKICGDFRTKLGVDEFHQGRH